MDIGSQLAEHSKPRPEDEPGFNLETLRGTHNYNRWIYSHMRPYLGGSVLELGCGIGNLTGLFLRDERQVLAIDIEEKMTREHARVIGAQPRLKLENRSIQSLLPEQAGTFDSVVSSNVLEHIPDGVEAEVLRSSYDLLKRGGVSTHWVPAMPCIYGSLDRRFEHFRRYGKRQLIQRFEAAGFKVERCAYRNVIGFFGWWWQARVLKVSRISPAAALNYDRYIVPVASRVERHLWLPFGQSLWIAARKIK